MPIGLMGLQREMSYCSQFRKLEVLSEDLIVIVVVKSVVGFGYLRLGKVGITTGSVLVAKKSRQWTLLILGGGLRPLVHLKEGAELVEQTDGSYDINIPNVTEE